MNKNKGKAVRRVVTRRFNLFVIKSKIVLKKTNTTHFYHFSLWYKPNPLLTKTKINSNVRIYHFLFYKSMKYIYKKKLNL